MQADRLPLPDAYVDPAFMACIDRAISTPDLLAEFDRLYGASLLIGQPTTADFRAFTNFVHDGIYMRLPDDAIHAMRAAHFNAQA